MSKLILNNNILESNQKPRSEPGFLFFIRSLISLMHQSKTLTHLSMASCNLGKETALAIGEGLNKNTKLITLNLRGNQIKMNGVREIVKACYENSKLCLRHVDFSSNHLCDQAG